MSVIHGACDATDPEFTFPKAEPDEGATAETAVFRFGTSTAAIAPGAHRLCWHASAASAKGVELDGAITMLGPRSFDFACTYGQPCVVSLDGTGLASENQLAVVEGPQSLKNKSIDPIFSWAAML